LSTTVADVVIGNEMLAMSVEECSKVGGVIEMKVHMSEVKMEESGNSNEERAGSIVIID
jgi:hypothetical protein